MAQKIHIEPADYIPEELRKKYDLGEYNKEAQEEARKLEEEQKKREMNQGNRDDVNGKK